MEIPVLGVETGILGAHWPVNLSSELQSVRDLVLKHKVMAPKG